jgi:hypothetical protein
VSGKEGQEEQGAKGRLTTFLFFLRGCQFLDFTADIDPEFKTHDFDGELLQINGGMCLPPVEPTADSSSLRGFFAGSTQLPGQASSTGLPSGRGRSWRREQKAAWTSRRAD